MPAPVGLSAAKDRNLAVRGWEEGERDKIKRQSSAGGRDSREPESIGGHLPEDLEGFSKGQCTMFEVTEMLVTPLCIYMH